MRKILSTLIVLALLTVTLQAAQFGADNFTVGADTALSAHTPSGGGTWTQHGSYADCAIADAKDALLPTAGECLNYHSGAPASADYDVASAHLFYTNNGAAVGVVGRVNTAANTFYRLDYYEGNYRLLKFVAGVYGGLGTDYTFTPSGGATTAILLRMAGDQISGYVAGVLRIGPVTDTDISAAGKAGVYTVAAGGTFSGDNGSYLDNYSADDPAGGGGASPCVIGGGIIGRCGDWWNLPWLDPRRVGARR